MKAFVYPTGRVIEPFLDLADQLPILDESLASQRRRVLKEGMGIDSVEPVEASVEVGSEPALLLFDHLYLTRQTVRDFLRQAEAHHGSAAVLALPRGPLTEFAAPLQDRVVETVEGSERVLFDAFVVRDVVLEPGEDPGALRRRILDGAERITLDPRVEVRFQRWPSIRGEKLGIDLPCSLWGAGHIDHWVHLLWLTRQAIETRLLEMAEAQAEQGKTFLYAGREYERMSKRRKPPVYMGENCNVHPMALLENVVLGDNVNIDLRSLIRNSVLGDNIDLSAATDLLGCSMGSGCHTLSHTCLIECVCMPHSSLSNQKLMHSISGREAFVTGAVAFTELGIDGDIEVEQDGQWVSSGRRILGGCIGHRCILGVRSVFEGGRAIPNGYMVVARKGESLSKITAGLEGQWTYNETGLLRPASEIDPPWDPSEW